MAAADQTISQLPLTDQIHDTDTSLIVKNGQDYRFSMTQLLEYFTQGQLMPQPIAAGTALGAPAKATIYYAGPGTYALPTGGNLVLTALLNILFWDKTKWTYLALSLDANSYVKAIDYNATVTPISNYINTLQSIINSTITNDFRIGDSKGNDAFIIDNTGVGYLYSLILNSALQVGNLKIDDDGNNNRAFSWVDRTGNLGMVLEPDGNLNVNSINRVKIQNSDDFAFVFDDEAGNIALAIDRNGSVRMNLSFLGFPTGGFLQNSFYGETWFIIGDSISSIANYPNEVNAQTIWWALIAKALGVKMIVNAIGGTCIAPSNEDNINHMSSDTRIRYAKTQSIAPDRIFVFAGTNDFTRSSVALGDPALFTESNTIGADFCQALRYMLHNLSVQYPHAQINYMTPIRRGDNPVMANGFPEQYGSAGGVNRTLLQYINAIQTICDNYGVKVIRTDRESGLTTFNMQTNSNSGLSYEGLHPKAEGHPYIAKAVLRNITNYYKT